MYKTGNVTLMVSNMDRAVAFYIEALGLELKVRYGNDWAEVVAPGVTFGLHQAHGPIARSDPAIGISIGLEVDDIEAAVLGLTAKGIAFPTGIRETSDLREASFADPDGTPLYLAEIKPQNR
ncbi:MAG TPA: VOC family protein [Chloroflexota bacterium]|nr:VOC family protein [Chloroflexota bacterium]